jgi:predicted phage terminase large subunit-like protein
MQRLAGSGLAPETLVAGLTDDEAFELYFLWRAWARPSQLEPLGEWTLWLLMAGRGFGKSRTGAETVRGWVETGRCGRLALVGRTGADVRDVMIEGESGLLQISPPWFRPVYEPSKRRLTWPNGAIATTYTAEEPEVLRGPQHDGAWCDEIGAWKYGEETWSNLMFGLRLGKDPRAVGTTTPRSTRFMRMLLADKTTRVTNGRTSENVKNLAPTFLRTVVGKYQGTRLGRQELEGEMLEDVPGALWKRAQIDELRLRSNDPRFREDFYIRLVVGVDPAVTTGEDSAETGIVVAGLGKDGHGYVLNDVSGQLSPDGWAKRVVTQYRNYQADLVVGETNNGGELVGHTVHTVDKSVYFKPVHASRGKRTRAEPVAALTEQGKIHHVGTFPELEDQLCTWDAGGPDKSPDRLDAYVWAFTELMVDSSDRYEEPDETVTARSSIRSKLGGF